jgi:tetratricopeptide (TPR) repeat protein
MIFDYWTGQENYLKDKYKGESRYLPFVSLYDLANFARSQGFEAEILTAKSIKDLHKFINPKEKTPVIVQQKPDINYPGKLRLMRVIIGLDDRRKVAILHDYAFGNNYEINYKDFDELWKETNRAYLVIRPKNYKEIIRRLPPKSNYPPRIPAMEQKKLLLIVTYTGELFFRDVPFQQWKSTLEELMKEEYAFQYFPPFWRVLNYGDILYYYIRILPNKEKALEYAKKIEGLNHNLTQPFDGWRYRWPYYDELGEAWIWVGNAYFEFGEREEAIKMYERAMKLKDKLSLDYQRFLQSRLVELERK